MNAVCLPSVPAAVVAAPVIAAAARAPMPVLPLRRAHRERDFGVGYGSSSGYASERRYAASWAPPRFRCA